MSRYFACDKVNSDRWGEIVWRKQTVPGGSRYIVTVAGRKIGEVWSQSGEWTAISYAHPTHLVGLRSVHGFATRWRATEYLLDVGVRPIMKDQ